MEKQSAKAKRKRHNARTEANMTMQRSKNNVKNVRAQKRNCQRNNYSTRASQPSRNHTSPKKTKAKETTRATRNKVQPDAATATDKVAVADKHDNNDDDGHNDHDDEEEVERGATPPKDTDNISDGRRYTRRDERATRMIDEVR